jgi:hypothetical protein
MVRPVCAYTVPSIIERIEHLANGSHSFRWVEFAGASEVRRERLGDTCLNVRPTYLSYRYSHVESLLFCSLVRLQDMHNTPDRTSGVHTTTPPVGLSQDCA